MKQTDYHIYLIEQEGSQVTQNLIELKNNLIAQGRYTDAATDVLINLSTARKKRIAVHSENSFSSLWQVAGVFPAFAKFQNVS